MPGNNWENWPFWYHFPWSRPFGLRPSRTNRKNEKERDARVSNLTMSVAELLGHPGEYRDVRLSEPLPGGVRTTLARLTEDPVSGDLRAESVIEGILVTGDVSGATVVQCARCLKEFDSRADVELCELYVGPGHDLSGSETDDTYKVTGTEINLEPMLRDAMTLALPLNPLCRADCKGLCAQCGADLNLGDCSCAEDETDPRWAPLETLKARLEEETQGPARSA